MAWFTLYNGGCFAYKLNQPLVSVIPDGENFCKTPGIRCAHLVCGDWEGRPGFKDDHGIDYGPEIIKEGWSSTARIVSGLLIDYIFSVSLILVARFHARLGLNLPPLIRTTFSVLGHTYAIAPPLLLATYFFVSRLLTFGPRMHNNQASFDGSLGEPFCNCFPLWLTCLPCCCICREGPLPH